MKRMRPCRFCQSLTENYVLVQRKVYNVKWYRCDPECITQTFVQRLHQGVARGVQAIKETLNRPSPFIKIMKGKKK